MSQITNHTIPNSGGAAFRAAANAYLQALMSASSGATAPSPTVAGMSWLDTGASPPTLKIRNNANTGWIDLLKETLPANTLRGNPTGSAAAEQDVSMAQLKAMLGFSQSLGTAGYQILPSGLIVQWFLSSAIASGTNVAQTLPVTFPTDHFGTIASYSNAGADVAVGSVYIGQMRGKTTSNVTLRNLGPNTASFFCISLGN